MELDSYTDARQRLVLDVLVGVALAVMVALVIIFSGSVAPTFVYQAF